MFEVSIVNISVNFLLIIILESLSRIFIEYSFWNKPFIKIESETIQINIIEPIGEDKDIWNFIKDKPEYASLMEFDELPDEIEKRTNIKQNLEQIINRHPNSLLAGQFKKSVEKFNQKEAKRNEERNKMVRQPNRPDPQ